MKNFLVSVALALTFIGIGVGYAYFIDWLPEVVTSKPLALAIGLCPVFVLTVWYFYKVFKNNKEQ